MLKLNLGSGKIKLDGYENIDIKDGRSAFPLDYDSETISEIRASHILEHFGKHEIADVLRDWVDKLLPGGVLKIAVPNFKKIAEKYVGGSKTDHPIDSYIMGGQTDQNDFHRSIFDPHTLYAHLKNAGLVDISTWSSDLGDCASYEISLNMMAKKPGGLETKIQAIMSMPRLAFTDNLCSAIKVFPKLGIGFSKGTGVFWGQVLSRLIQQFLDDGTEYIITVDYDTWYREEHVIRLLQLMAENPNVDAIVPVQIKRNNEVPMFSIVDADNPAGVTMVPVSRFDNELVPIVGGHFGLTIFRTSAFDDKLEKPWFQAHPNADGDWGEGHIDEDIHFWHNFNRCGKNAALATNIHIGHIQQICTFPGPPHQNFKPVQYYLNQMEKGQYGSHCVPQIEMKK